MIDQDTQDYVRRVAEVLGTTLGSDIAGVYLVGSLAYEDYAPDRSDIDVLVVASHPVSAEAKRELAHRLDHRQLPCPAMGLDLAIFRSETVSQPPPEPPYEFAIATGATWDLEASEGGAESELLVDFAVCRARGKCVSGPPTTELFGEVPRDVLRNAMRIALGWALQHVYHPLHDPLGHFAVLNVCRAWCFLEEGTLCSKSEGGEWALKQQPSWSVITEALAIQGGRRRDRLDRDRVRELIDRVAGL